MKHQVESLISSALDELIKAGSLPAECPLEVQIERARDKQFGDFASNIAMSLARVARCNPRELAQKIIDALPPSSSIEKVEIAGPGFINFYLAADAYHGVLLEIMDSGETFGRSNIGAGQKIQVEFVSANPTGPLHVGHGRGAAYGATVADLLEAVGCEVHREYYINDAGRQMDILAASVWVRYLELCGHTLPFPVNGYQGDYVFDIAANLHRELGDKLGRDADLVTADLPKDETDGGDKEIYIDALIKRCKDLLGDADFRRLFDEGLNDITENIRQDLKEFGIEYQDWFSERSLTESGVVDDAVKRLQDSGYIYEDKGALWFKSTEFGDEKDRVVVRDNGQMTYFASDIAYHMNKLERGFDRVIDVWGADHHGYIPRVRAALKAMGADADKLDVLLVQFAVLYRGGEKVQMSTRSGEFVTLRELREEVGQDAARFFYVMRKCEQHLDFDLDLATSKSNENPVFYIQYAHARVCSVLRQMQEKALTWDQVNGRSNLGKLVESHELDLMVSLSRFPEIVESSALSHEPHQLAHYLRDLANDFHTYYNAHQFLVEDVALRDARLLLIQATRQAIANGLGLLGLSAPESM